MKQEFLEQGGQLGARGGLTGITWLNILFYLFSFLYCQSQHPSLKSNLFVSGAFYAWMVRTKCVDAVNAVYPDGDAIWQDDPASIHRTKDAIAACSAFPERIPHDQQAAKCSDIWPIEQVCTFYSSEAFLLMIVIIL